jgi:poly-gamma-glutamate synthesis protein (capsule biosynthesis protein)
MPSNHSRQISVCATGDSFITRRLPSQDDPDFRQLAAIIGQSECRFTNLETVIRRDEGFPFAISGGTWASSPPEVLEDLKAFGFNIVNAATNHALDYAYGGLEATRRYLREAGLPCVGVGATLAEASAPQYLELPGGRVAWVGATFTFQETWRAGAQRPDGPGRPGVNPLRVKKTFFASRNQIQTLRQVAARTGINDIHQLRIKEGFVPPDPKGALRFGDMLFRVGSPARVEAQVIAPDRDRLLGSIHEARRQADFVLVSVHCHDMKEADKSLPPDYLVQFAHDCIDGGAHAIVGHGPHVLRGIEIYRRKPIFYSLGDFIFQPETVTQQPADFYEKYNLDPSGNIADAFDQQTRQGAIGLGVNPDVWRSVVATWTMTGPGAHSITLRPITLGFGAPRYTCGWPTLARGKEARDILQHLAQLSKPLGTTLDFDGDSAQVRVSGRK